MNLWLNCDKNNENFLSDYDQLTHQYRSTFVILFVHDSSVSSEFAYFAYIFYLWKCCCNLCAYSTYIGYVNIIHYTTYLFCRPSDIHIHLKINGCVL